MKGSLGIAELKAHLSDYVRAAQKGKEIIIKDRQTPIAKLTPLTERKLPFRIIPASRPIKGINEMQGISVSVWKPQDIERAIAETRADRVDTWSNLDTSTLTRR